MTKNGVRRLYKLLLAMKLTILLLTIAGLHAYSLGWSQETVSLSVKGMELRKLFALLQRESSYKFLYKDEVVPDSVRVSLNVSGTPVPQVLDQALRNTALTYKVLDNDLVVITPLSLVFQDILVQGMVKDDTGNPLPGATIKVKGSKAGTQTGSDGSFSIRVPDDAVLQISAVGFASLEVPARNFTAVALKRQVGSLDQVVIVGYGTQKQSDITGAVGTISGKVLEDRPIVNVGRGLMGEVPGLNITSASGQPGSPAVFNIRGFTSINGGTPLILVDGISTSPDDINPLDIASVTVLKDAASAAVYGARGPFGVVLITTKSGKKGAPTISYSANYAVKKITHLPDVVTDPYTVATMQNTSYSAYYGTNLHNASYMAWVQQISKDPSMSRVRVDPANPAVYDYAGSTNWFNEIYAPTNSAQIHNLTVSGGGDKLDYYLSGGYNQQQGVFRYDPDVYNRYNLRAKLNLQVNKWLRLYTNSAYNRTNYNAPSLWTSDWTSGDLYHQIGRQFSLSTPENPDRSWTSSGVYVGFLTQGGRSNTVTNEFQNTIGFESDFFNNTWRVKGDYTFRSTDDYTRAYQIPENYETGPSQTVYQAGHSNASNSADTYAYTDLNLYSEYENTFNKHHYFKALLGYNQEMNSYDGFSASNNDLISDAIGYLSGTTGAVPTVSGTGNEWTIRGAFSRLNYAYDGKYLLEVDGRYDGSSKFPTNNQYVFLPSGSLGWKVSEEQFFYSLKPTISALKLRASYGALGNNQSLTSDYPFVPLLSSGQIANVLGGAQPTAVYAPNLVDPNLKWETIYTKDLGVDMTVMRHLDVTFDVFQRDTKNMISNGPELPAVLGNTPPLQNAADLRTSGWELNLNYTNQFNIGASPFHFSIHAGLWDNQTVITKYGNPSKYWFGGDYYVGQHVGDIWGLSTAGIFQTNAEASQAPDQTVVEGYYGQQAGEIKYKDLNKDGKVDYGAGTVANPGDARVIGNTTPRYSFGFGTNMSWHSIDLSVFFQGIGKESFWPGTSGYYWSQFFSPWDNVYKNIIGTTWTPQNPNAFYPSLKGWRAGDDGAWRDLAVPQTRYIFSAAYMRLKNLSIGYTLPMPALHRAGIKQVRFYFSGEDLWEWTKLPKVFDPEGLGGSWGAGKIYPFQRGYSFGADIRF